jgi:ribosomal protein S27AE
MTDINLFVASTASAIADSVARNGLDITDVLERLNGVDWNLFISAARAEHEKRRSEWDNEVLYCRKCRKDIKRKDLVYFRCQDYSEKIPFCVDLEGCYCADCVPSVEQELMDRYQRKCSVCGAVFFARRSDAYGKLCEIHDTPEYRKEALRVKSNNERTTKLSLVSDLTLEEWLDVVSLYGNKCADCGGEWTDLDHIIPVSRGGGTTKSNVRPLCGRCNSVKSDKEITVMQYA